MVVSLYIVLVILGWLNIYSASLPIEETSIFDFSPVYGKQMLFVILSIPLIIVILSIDAKIFEKFSSVIFIVSLVSYLIQALESKPLSSAEVFWSRSNKRLFSEKLDSPTIHEETDDVEPHEESLFH